MVGWHHQLHGYESEQIPEDGERQGSLECCSPWGPKLGTGLGSKFQVSLSMALSLSLKKKYYLFSHLFD